MPKPSGTPRPDPMAREVDRLLAGLAYRGPQPDERPARGDGPKPNPRGDGPKPNSVPRRASRPKPRAEATTRATLAALWARVGLGVLLGGMITQWPYAHACGLPLLAYFGAITMVIVAGAWAAVASWTRRHPSSHVLGLLLVLWGIALAAYQILPRVGYAAERWGWQC
jgi:hypothetical protein